MLLNRTLSLTARLTIGYTLSSVGLILISSLYLYWSLVKALDSRNEKFFSSKVEAVRSLLAREDEGRALRFRIEKEWPARTSEIFYVRLFDGEDRILAKSPGGDRIFERLPEPGETRRPSPTANGKSDLLRLDGVVFRSVTMLLEQAGERYVLQMVLDRTEETSILSDYRFRLLAVLMICFVGSLFVCFEIARRGLRPIQTMANSASRITLSNLDKRILPNEMPSELAHLAETFDAMLDRLKASFERLQRFSADIAHELRTPINNISGELQVALGKERTADYYKEAIGSCLEECNRISRIIDSLLFLARAENPRIELAKEAVNLRKELQTVLEFYEAAASENGIICALDVDDEITLQVERTLFQRAVGNIISNAINKTNNLGRIQITARRKSLGVEIEFEDSGIGIPSEHLPHLFDRFYRVDASRTKSSGGSGLGLAIVKSIASIHGGDVAISSELGVGTRVCLFFPIKTQQGLASS